MKMDGVKGVEEKRNHITTKKRQKNEGIYKVLRYNKTTK
jgi:hypothetical protein